MDPCNTPRQRRLAQWAARPERDAGRLPPWLPGIALRPPVTSDPPPAPICSARGCRSAATWVLAWNNPRVHTPERRKNWAACEEHRESLAAFLDARGFLKDTLVLGGSMDER